MSHNFRFDTRDPNMVLVPATKLKEMQQELREALQKNIEHLAAIKSLSAEYHAAINEPEYAGTRADWMARATTAEYKYEEALKALAEFKEFKDRVIDECVTSWVYTKEHETNPKKALSDIIKWHQQVALDPAVCKDMADLRDAVIGMVEFQVSKEDLETIRNLFSSVNVKSS